MLNELTFRGGEESTIVRTSTAALVERRYPRDLVIGRHAHEYACVDLVLCGGVRERYRSCDREGCAGELLFYAPDAGHAWASGREGARILHMIFRREDAIGTFEAPIEATRLPRLATALHQELRSQDASALSLESLAAEIVMEVGTWRLRERSRPAWLDDAVEMCMQSSPTLAELAAATGVNAGHLVRTFRERVGCTPGELSRRARIGAAARRLSTGDESLAQVAFDAGFSDQAHLTRVFRRRFGVTPGVYRRRYRA